VLRRLDISLESVDEIRLLDFRQIMNTHNLDIVAAVPKNIPVLQHICETKDTGVSFIVLDFNVRLQLQPMSKCWKSAMEQGIFFEVSYAQAVFDVSARR
jgi:hypothetical protein